MERPSKVRKADPVELPIVGMTCASCAARVEKAIRRVPGVESATVNLATERARVDLHGASLATVMEAVRAAGYDVKAPAADEGARERGQRALLLLSVALTLPLLAPMLTAPFGFHAMLPGLWQFALAGVVQAVAGASFYRAAWKALRDRAGNMDQLVSLGTTAAFLLSAYELFVHGGPLYFESSAAVLTFVRLGKYLEGRAKRKTGEALRALESLRPARARRRLADGNEELVDVNALRAGDLVVVAPGERFPADGRVQEGRSDVDESLLTGESRPVPKEPGAEVVGGAVNGDGLLLVVVTRTGTESFLARVIRLVEEAQGEKAPVERLVDRVSAVFVPAVLAAALLTTLAWGFLGGDWAAALLHGVAVLVISCPCALGLATPAALLVGVGAAARAGILVRDAATLESAEAIDVVAFDKTGTLTQGQPRLLGQRAEGISEDAALALAARLQRHSSHPLAAAFRAAHPGGPDAADLRAIPGRGVRGQVNKEYFLLGNARLLEEAGVAIGSLGPWAAEEAARGHTIAYLASEAGAARAVFSFGDELRPTARPAVDALRARGLRVALLTGDHPSAAARVAESLGILELRAGLRPEEKAAYVAELRRGGSKVAMVGDGVNDAPALAAADLGIAVGSGSDVALHTAGLTLLRPDPALVPVALRLGSRTLRKIRQNLFWAFLYNTVGIPLAALGYLSPLLAGAAMALSSVSVVANALLLRGAGRSREDR